MVSYLASQMFYLVSRRGFILAQHEYSQIRSKLNIPLILICQSEADLNLISSILNGSVEVPEMLFSIKLRVPSHNTTNHNGFHIPFRTTSVTSNAVFPQ